MIKPNWILQRTDLSPEKIALIDVHTKQEWTYRTLRNQIEKWLIFMETENLNKGDRVAILARNNMELFAIMFACGITGLIYVPINYRLSEVEMDMLLKDSGATILLYDSQFTKIVKLISLKRKLRIDMTKSKVVTAPMMSTIQNTDAWLMIYTGGTTGKPKGVVLSHEAVNFNAMNTVISWGLSEDDKTINYMPLFHTGGINALSIPILMAGGTVVIGDVFDPEEALQATDKYQATISLFVPTMYQAMIEHPYFEQSNFTSMKVFLSGGAPCPPTIYHRFHEKELLFKEGYGLTEAGPNNFFIRPEVARKKIGSVGKSMLFNEVQIVKDDGTLCGTNEVGELYVKGKHLFSIYWNRKEESESNLVNGWLKTGDLAKKDEDGDYYIIGRKKDMIITGGENVYPQEVEQCLVNNKMICEAAVIGIPDKKWGEKVVAIITVSDGTQFKEVEVKAYCKQHLGTFKVPKQFIIVDELPKTDVGKIDKQQLLQYVLQKK